jgi:hypothetical protein
MFCGFAQYLVGHTALYSKVGHDALLPHGYEIRFCNTLSSDASVALDVRQSYGCGRRVQAWG